MIRLPTWKIVFVLIMCIGAFAYSAPNLMNKEQAEAWQAKVPSWLPSKTVNLGLDLQGGSHLMLEVGLDVTLRDNAENDLGAARTELRTLKLATTSMRPLPNGFSITMRNAEDMDAAKSAIRKLDPDLIVSNGTDPNSITTVFSDAKIKKIKDRAIEQSIEIVRRRVDESGTREPVIARQGDNRIVVQLPGLNDPEHVKGLLGKTAKLGFHLVDQEASLTGRAGMNSVVLPMQENPGQKIAVIKRPLISGDMLENAQPGFRDGMPVVTFKFNATGTKRFCDASRANIGKPFAIVLDDVVISAPSIREAICGGSGEISGGFTVQQSSDLSLLLRAGALPAPLKIVEERSVGPSLGSDSVAAGKKACLIALGFVMIFVCAVYGLFGIFASFALIINMLLIVAAMSLLQATLTLPGIAGMVLAIGLAVDGNVLVYERIKEELRDGRSIISAIDIGYNRARTTILDSNLTALISALILFSFGTGPIKGFAVTTCIGVVTSYFCSLMLTNAIVLTWLRIKKPKSIEV